MGKIMDNELLTLKTVATELGICVPTLNKIIGAGRIQTINLNGKPRIRRVALDGYLNSSDYQPVQPPVTKDINSKQLQLKLGIDLKNAGLDLVELNNLTWVERMREIAKQFSSRFGFVSADDLRKYADETDDQPKHPNAWGSIFRGSGWHVIGRTKSTTPSAHAREIMVWKWVTPSTTN